MTKQNEKIALFDMDGTLCNFNGTLLHQLNELSAPCEAQVYSLDNLPEHIDRRATLIKAQKDWWFNLSPIMSGMLLLEEAHRIGFKIHILTKGPFKSTAAWEEKVLWCRKHVDRLVGGPVDITITTDKGLTYGTVLVDDYPDYIDRWLKWRPRGRVIMPAREWNRGYTGGPAHDRVVQYYGQADYAETVEHLQNIFDAGTIQ